jgi:MYXO-CTERM domain-containing protein
MRGFVRFASALPVLAALTLASAPASAFCRSTTCTGDCPRDEDGCKTTGEPLAWPGLCVGVSLQRDGTANHPMDDVRSAIEAAIVAWSEIDCGDGPASLAFSPEDDVSCKRAEYNEDAPNANVILFQDTRWEYKGVDNNLAKTTVTFDPDTGEIFDADIEINHAYNEFTIGDDAIVYDLQSVVTHEIGHMIGLDHTPEVSATMFAGYEPGTIEIRTLDVDDVDALCTVYPPGRAGKCDPTPRNGLGDACGGEATGEDEGDAGGCSVGHGEAPGIEAALLALLGLAARRRKASLSLPTKPRS